MSSPVDLHGVVAPREHGGALASELAALGIAPGEVLDVSTSINPYGPAPEVERAVRAAPLDRYPEPDSATARAALAQMCGTGPERVVLGNGATELLWTLARLLLAPGETLLACEPSFSELRAAASAVRARVVEWRADAAQDFALDLDAIARRARDERARVVALCVPASPTGVVVPVEDVARLARELPGATIVLDQSFLASSERHQDLAVTLPERVVCVRSVTKEHAIPGVRVGYLLATPALAAGVETSRPAWTVGAAAQAAAVAITTPAARTFVARTRERMLAERAALAAELRARGFATVPSATGFFVADVGDATAVRRELLVRHRVLVRDCTSFGMPRHVRVAARGGADGRRIADAFADLAVAARATAASAPAPERAHAHEHQAAAADAIDRAPRAREA